MIGAITVSALLILFAGVYTGLYRVDDSVKELGKILLIVFALYAPVKVEIQECLGILAARCASCKA